MEGENVPQKLIDICDSYCTFHCCGTCKKMLPKSIRVCFFHEKDTSFCHQYVFQNSITLQQPSNVICNSVNDTEFLFFLGSPFIEKFEKPFQWGTFEKNTYVQITRRINLKHKEEKLNNQQQEQAQKENSIDNKINFEMYQPDGQQLIARIDDITGAMLRVRKELKFIHITKTAGSSIETCAKNENILWGSHHKEYGSWNKGRSPGNGVWHTFFKNQPMELKQKFDWFVVVRNPYDRILSEVYCPYAGRDRPKIKRNESGKTEFNDYIQRKIQTRYELGDHYGEQCFYIEKGVHVIRYEALQSQFEQLMCVYGLPIQLNLHINKTTPMRGGEARFTIEDFSKETIALINSVYDQDFELLQYEKISS